MKFTFEQKGLSKIRSVVRLNGGTRSVGNVDVFYGVYSITTSDRELCAVAVGEDDELRFITLDSFNDGIRLYELVAENEVDLVSFDAVAEDHLLQKTPNNIL